jgi:hypothetical protein
MVLNQSRLITLDTRQIAAIRNLVEMRVTEYKLSNENPSIIAIYEGILQRLGGQ